MRRCQWQEKGGRGRDTRENTIFKTHGSCTPGGYRTRGKYQDDPDQLSGGSRVIRPGQGLSHEVWPKHVETREMLGEMSEQAEQMIVTVRGRSSVSLKEGE